MCYTAPSAHVMIGRFVGNNLFDCKEAQLQFLGLIKGINDELIGRERSRNHAVWSLGEPVSLELQLGHVRFGRPRERAEMVGSSREVEVGR
ncbi:hypothetical protein P154DRAFT_523066 [Amniculicola lignicola CBS 123094]|uniref:Uncharacterized protein n=1 Tax=Amniculicola lignicola CBS 123094 TaxID=1392246 RepID=A0A6A5WQ79_9PLEO|nr:hypothetical protein P154DRAFT_523066 [Amniculicola lignicola CBS 123094]